MHVYDARVAQSPTGAAAGEPGICNQTPMWLEKQDRVAES